MKLFNQLEPRDGARTDPMLRTPDEKQLVKSIGEYISLLIEHVRLADAYFITDQWYGSFSKYVQKHWLQHVVAWCDEPTHFHMTLEDYLAALLGVPAGDKNFFELLPDENRVRPEREFAEFFKLAGGTDGTDT